MNRIWKGKNSCYKALTNCWFLDYRLKAEHIGILYTIFSQSDKFNMNKAWILDNVGITPDRNYKAFNDLIDFGYIEKLGSGRNTEYNFNEVPYDDFNEYKKIVKQHNKKIGKYAWRKTMKSESSSNKKNDECLPDNKTNEILQTNITMDKVENNSHQNEGETTLKGKELDDYLYKALKENFGNPKEQ